MTTLITATSDTVLMLLRRLPPRERLRVVAQVLPELESELPVAPPETAFWRGASMAKLIEQQGVKPIEVFDTLLGGWPSDESVDDFVQAVRESRQQYLAEAEAE
jgi:hypothetical protein